MPYVPTNPDDEDQKKSIAGTDDAGLDGTGGQNFLSPQQSGMSGWTDVHAYLDANKGQALGMSKDLGDKIGGEADTLRGDIGSSEKSFEDTVGKNRVDLDQGEVDKAFTNPADYTKDDANVAKFTKMRDANYGGPNSFSDSGDYGKLSARAAEGTSRANLIDTDAGRQSLLFEGPGNPTKGQVTLDSLLIAGSPESRDALKAGAGKFSGITDYLDQQSNQANTAAAGAKTATDATSKAVKDRLASETTNFKQGVTSRLDQTKAQTKAALDAARTKLLAGQDLSDADIAALSGDRTSLAGYKNYESTKGALGDDYGVSLDPNNFYSEKSPDNEFSLDNTSSPEDFAKAAALAKLGGSDLGILNPANAGQAGTAPKALGKFDFSGAQSDAQKQLRQQDLVLLNQGVGPANPSAADKKKYTDAFLRNPSELTNNQIMWLHDNGVDTSGMGQGTGVPNNPPTNPNLRINNGAFEYRDPTSGTWGPAPQETKTNPDGTWSKFNYDTGKYEVQGGKMPTVGFGGTSGVY